MRMLRECVKLAKQHSETILYLFFGVLTVIVNTLVFMLLSRTVLGDLWANTIAFFVAVQFAYFTNTKYVFKADFTKQNLLQFWGMRIGTIFIDNFGLMILLHLGAHKLIAKSAVNIVIIGLNYLFSKFIIYRKKDEGESE